MCTSFWMSSCWAHWSFPALDFSWSLSSTSSLSPLLFVRFKLSVKQAQIAIHSGKCNNKTKWQYSSQPKCFSKTVFSVDNQPQLYIKWNNSNTKVTVWIRVYEWSHVAIFQQFNTYKIVFDESERERESFWGANQLHPKHFNPVELYSEHILLTAHKAFH